MREMAPVLVDASRLARGLENSGKLVDEFTIAYLSEIDKYKSSYESLTEDVQAIEDALKSSSIYDAASIIVSKEALLTDIDQIVDDIETGGREFLEKKLKEAKSKKAIALKVKDKLAHFTPDQILSIFSNAYKEYTIYRENEETKLNLIVYAKENLKLNLSPDMSLEDVKASIADAEKVVDMVTKEKMSSK